MAALRYDTSGQWYKGNIHIHSRASDGGMSFREIADLYAPAGYDFLFRTDHWVFSDVSADPDRYPLLWLDGIELDGQDRTGSPYHVVCLGRVVDLPRDAGFEACLRSAHQQGALLVLAHPHWTGNSLEDALRHGFDGVEIYNHVCHWLNGKSGGLVHWDAMLGPDPGALSFAVDDAHLRPEHPGWNGGWIMVNAKERSATEILASIRRGHFYSTCGPEIHSIHIDGDQLCLRTSPIRFARLAGPGAIGRRVGRFDGPLVTEVRIPVSRDWHYVYAEVEDGNGRRAWTNTLFPAVRRG